MLQKRPRRVFRLGRGKERLLLIVIVRRERRGVGVLQKERAVFRNGICHAAPAVCGDVRRHGLAERREIHRLQNAERHGIGRGVIAVEPVDGNAPPAAGLAGFDGCGGLLRLKGAAARAGVKLRHGQGPVLRVGGLVPSGKQQNDGGDRGDEHHAEEYPAREHDLLLRSAPRAAGGIFFLTGFSVVFHGEFLFPGGSSGDG